MSRSNKLTSNINAPKKSVLGFSLGLFSHKNTIRILIIRIIKIGGTTIGRRDDISGRGAKMIKKTEEEENGEEVEEEGIDDE